MADLVEKAKVDVVATHDQVNKVVQIMATAAHTGEIGERRNVPSTLLDACLWHSMCIVWLGAYATAAPLRWERCAVTFVVLLHVCGACKHSVTDVQLQL